MGKLIAPNGFTIIGTYETVPGIAGILDVQPPVDGKFQLEWDGHTEIMWDGQVTDTDPTTGERIFIDEFGVPWEESLLKYEESEDDEA